MTRGCREFAGGDGGNGEEIMRMTVSAVSGQLKIFDGVYMGQYFVLGSFAAVLFVLVLLKLSADAALSHIREHTVIRSQFYLSRCCSLL